MNEQERGVKPHVLQIVGDPVGGIRRHVHSLLTGLHQKGYVVSYAYSNISTDQAFSADMRLFGSFLKNIIPLAIYKKPHVQDIWNILLLVRCIKNNNIQIVHGHGAKAGIYARLAGRMGGAKSVYTPHGGVAHDMFSKYEKWIYVMVEQALSFLTDYYLFESQYTKESMSQLISRSALNSSVNPNGIDVVDRSSLVNSSVILKGENSGNIFHLGVFAMLRHEKGQSLVIKAISDLKLIDSTVFLHLFGDGPTHKELIREVESLGLSDFVFFYGDVTPVEPWMAAMDLVIVPSQFESFGYVAVEALSLDRPVIAQSVGGLQEILSEFRCFLVPPGNVQELQNRILKFVNDPRSFRKAAKEASKYVMRKYTSQAMVDGVDVVYTNLMAER